MFLMLLTLLSASAQDRRVSGKISGADGAIPGATVLLKGSVSGTATNANGEYTLAIKGSNPVLVISGIGYKTKEVTVGAQSTVNVTLEEDVTSLSEVIVTGYAITNKKESTAAVSIVKAKDLQVVPSGNVEQQLQGRVAGVTVITNGQPGTSSIIRVRGFGALGGNEPLYVVDGVPVGSTDFLAPDDIETTTVLKDAAAASIYGARAANGVIVYTTKKGTKSPRKLSITYDGLYGSTDPNVAGAPKMLTPQEQADWTHVAYRNNAAANGTAVAYTHPQYGTSAQATLPTYLHANGQNGVRGTVDLAAIQAAAAARPGSASRHRRRRGPRPHSGRWRWTARPARGDALFRSRPKVRQKKAHPPAWRAPSPAGGRARSAKVTGPPSTSSTGTNMLRVMCSPMCTLNIADP